jgi:hypothetical protein
MSTEHKHAVTPQGIIPEYLRALDVDMWTFGPKVGHIEYYEKLFKARHCGSLLLLGRLRLGRLYFEVNWGKKK